MLAPDFALITAFLAEVDSSKKTWHFRLVVERSGEERYGAHEAFKDLRVEQLRGILEIKQLEGHGVFVEAARGKYVRLPGTHDVRGKDVRANMVSLDQARGVLSRLRAGGDGDELAEPALHGGGGSSSLDPADAKKGVSDAHLNKLRARGLTEATIESAGIYTISAKKTIAERLSRPRWNHGSVCCFPHPGCGSTDLQTAPFRALSDTRVPVTQHLSVDAVWSAETTGEPYLLPKTLEDGAYDDDGDLYIVLDEIDALYLSQHYSKVVGSENVDAFFDTNYRMDTGGDERLRTCFTDNVPLQDVNVTIFCYPKIAGKKRHEAYKLGAMLADLGACRIAFVELKAALPSVVTDQASLDRTVLTARVPNPNELRTAALTLQDILGTDMPATDLHLLIPKDYEVKPTGELIQYTTTQTAQGAFQNAQRISLAPFFITRIHREFESRKEKCEIAYKQGTTWVTRVVPSEQVFRRNQIVGLSEFGVPVSDKNAAAAVSWFHDFRELNDLEQRFTVIDNFVRTGWHAKEDGTPFYACPGVPGLSFDTQNGHAAQFKARDSKAGTLEEQLSILSEVMQSYDAGLLAILTSAGSMLLGRVKAATNVWLHTYGQTTSGKSLFLAIASSLHGHPKELMLKGDATAAGFEQALGTFSGTIIPIDETTLINPEDVPPRVYMAYDGVGKTRATRTGGAREPKKWNNGVLSTGEKPITDDNSQNGVQVRVLNVQCEELSPSYIPQMYDRIVANHGNMIVPMKAMLDACDFDALDATYADILRRFIARCTALNINARVANNLATLTLGGWALKRCFGDKIYLPANLEDKLIEILTGDRFARADVRHEHERALEALQSYIFTNPGTVLGISDDVKERSKVVARERVDKNLAFTSAWLSKFLKSEGFNPRSVRAAWAKRHYVLKASEGRTDTVCSFEGVVGRYVILDGRLFTDNSTTLSVEPPGGGGGGDDGGGGSGPPSGGGEGPKKTGRGVVRDLPKTPKVPIAAKAVSETAIPDPTSLYKFPDLNPTEVYEV